ncbi:hypothetical protein PAPYR_8113 [Paratrimastix pyriformis]|uniref:Uncharacterized protein n=1 Tax=Paratrimastix pyriformis TaxID=342808 RepID=A0ABQ8UFJ2_9EUKA|nr:hypothetical protein PAPYR_8113 [Paratrimastix pyriformis]
MRLLFSLPNQLNVNLEVVLVRGRMKTPPLTLGVKRKMSNVVPSRKAPQPPPVEEKAAFVPLSSPKSSPPSLKAPPPPAMSKAEKKEVQRMRKAAFFAMTRGEVAAREAREAREAVEASALKPKPQKPAPAPISRLAGVGNWLLKYGCRRIYVWRTYNRWGMGRSPPWAILKQLMIEIWVKNADLVPSSLMDHLAHFDDQPVIDSRKWDPPSRFKPFSTLRRISFWKRYRPHCGAFGYNHIAEAAPDMAPIGVMCDPRQSIPHEATQQAWINAIPNLSPRGIKVFPFLQINISHRPFHEFKILGCLPPEDHIQLSRIFKASLSPAHSGAFDRGIICFCGPSQGWSFPRLDSLSWIAQQALEEGFRGQIEPTLIQIAIPLEDTVILPLFLSLLKAKLGYVPRVDQSKFKADFPLTFDAVSVPVTPPLPMSPSAQLESPPVSESGSAPASPFSPAAPLPTTAAPVPATPPPPSPTPLEGQVEGSGTGWLPAQTQIETSCTTGDALQDLQAFAAASLENLFSPGPACPDPNPRVIPYCRQDLVHLSLQVDLAADVVFNGNDPIAWNPLALPDGAVLHFPPGASSTPPPGGLVRPLPQFPDGERNSVPPTAPPERSGYIIGGATTDGRDFRVREKLALLHHRALLLIARSKRYFSRIPDNCPSVPAPARSPSPPRDSPPPFGASPLSQLPLTPLLPLLIIASPAGTPVEFFDRETLPGSGPTCSATVPPSVITNLSAAVPLRPILPARCCGVVRPFARHHHPKSAAPSALCASSHALYSDATAALGAATTLFIFIGLRTRAATGVEMAKPLPLCRVPRRSRMPVDPRGERAMTHTRGRRVVKRVHGQRRLHCARACLFEGRKWALQCEAHPSAARVYSVIRPFAERAFEVFTLWLQQQRVFDTDVKFFRDRTSPGYWSRKAKHFFFAHCCELSDMKSLLQPSKFETDHDWVWSPSRNAKGRRVAHGEWHVRSCFVFRLYAVRTGSAG